MTSGAPTAMLFNSGFEAILAIPGLGDFLTVSGIAGFAIVDPQTPPQIHNLATANLVTNQSDKAKSATTLTVPSSSAGQLIETLMQVFETIPPVFDSFELAFDSYQARIHRIDEDALLLVLTQADLDETDYALKLTPCLQALTHDRATILNRLSTPIVPTPPIGRPIAPPIGRLIAPPVIPAIAPPTVTAALGSQTVTIGAVLTAMNHVIDISVQYLGKTILNNQLKQSCPADPWFESFTIQTDNQLKLIITSAIPPDQPLTADQHAGLRQWIEQVIRAVRRVIRNFRELLQQQLTTTELSVLFTEPASHHG
jgi:hypothetical protein